MYNINKIKEGSALFIAMLAGLILISLSGILLTSVNNEIRTRRASEERQSAKYLAEAGIEHAVYLYNKKINDMNKEDKYEEISYFDSREVSNNLLSINDIGKYSFSYQLDNTSQKKKGVIKSTGTTIKGTQYGLKAIIDIETGKIESWQEDK